MAAVAWLRWVCRRTEATVVTTQMALASIGLLVISRRGDLVFHRQFPDSIMKAAASHDRRHGLAAPQMHSA